jgi:elongation factor P
LAGPGTGAAGPRRPVSCSRSGAGRDARPWPGRPDDRAVPAAPGGAQAPVHVAAVIEGCLELCYDHEDLGGIFFGFFGFFRARTPPVSNMATIQATRLRKGMLIKLGGDLFRILDLQHVTPGNLRGFVRVRLRNIRTSALADQKLRSEDQIERETLDEKQMQFLYRDGTAYHFMDTSTYEQIPLSDEVLGEAVNYLVPEAVVQMEFYGSEPVGIELPPTVDLRVEETAPGIKGATASAQVKPARLETGLVVQVPPFVNTGDLVRVNTETGAYQSRA